MLYIYIEWSFTVCSVKNRKESYTFVTATKAFIFQTPERHHGIRLRDTWFEKLVLGQKGAGGAASPSVCFTWFGVRNMLLTCISALRAGMQVVIHRHYCFLLRMLMANGKWVRAEHIGPRSGWRERERPSPSPSPSPSPFIFILFYF